MKKPLILAGSMVLILGISACDNSEDETRISDLENQLQASQTETEGLRAQYDEAQARIAEYEGAADQAIDTEAMHEPMTTALASIDDTSDQLQQLEQALRTEGFDQVSLEPLRANLDKARQSIDQIAQSVGLDAASPTPQ